MTETTRKKSQEAKKGKFVNKMKKEEKITGRNLTIL